MLKSGKVAFDPPPAAARRAAISRLGMGRLAKLGLRLPRRAWDGDRPRLRGADHAAWVDVTNPRGGAVLMGLRAGSGADANEAQGPAAGRSTALAELRAAFESDFPAPPGAQASGRGADLFARGAYSFLPPGATPQVRAAFLGPDRDGWQVFAGEACAANLPATVHGALQSGRAAALSLS